MIDLQVSRKQIDEIDSQIVKLFEERMKVANEVAKYKMETGKAVFDKEREEQKLDSLSKISHGKFNERAVRELFSQIMSISRKYQYGVLPHTDDITDFEKTEKRLIKNRQKYIILACRAPIHSRRWKTCLVRRYRGSAVRVFRA